MRNYKVSLQISFAGTASKTPSKKLTSRFWTVPLWDRCCLEKQFAFPECKIILGNLFFVFLQLHCLLVRRELEPVLTAKQRWNSVHLQAGLHIWIPVLLFCFASENYQALFDDGLSWFRAWFTVDRRRKEKKWSGVDSLTIKEIKATFVIILCSTHDLVSCRLW